MKIRTNKKYKSKFKMICFVLFMLIALLVALANVQAAEEKQYINYIVQPGDGIDTIALKYYPDEYLPKARYEIKKFNHMIESDIYPGQILKLEMSK